MIQLGKAAFFGAIAFFLILGLRWNPIMVVVGMVLGFALVTILIG